MKKNFKKVLSSALAAFILVSGTPALSAFATEKEEFEFMHIAYGDSGEYGSMDYEYVVPEEYESEFEFIETQSVINYASQENLLPASHDSRDLNIVTSPKNQSTTSNCWIFSCISALETDSIMKGLTKAESTDFSEAHLAWFSNRTLSENENDLAYGDGINYDSPYDEGGNWRIAAAALARRSGLANESSFPFSTSNYSKMGNYTEAERYVTDSGVILESVHELGEETEIKEWVLEHGSIVASFNYSDSYFRTDTDAYYHPNSYSTNHMIAIIGWDDNYSADNFKASDRPEADGAWLCKNSWGTNWGDGGYFWISYHDTTLGYFTGLTVRSAEDMSNNYSYNGANWRTALMTSGSIQAANIFTAKNCEKLTSVSTYTAKENTSVKISVYNNLPANYKTPTEGTKVAYAETTLEKLGYHTIYIDTPVDLKQGDIFSIVIEYKCSGITGVPMEKNGSNEYSYSCRSGETFVNTNASNPNWKPSSNYGMQNAYIQAMTVSDECSHSETEITVLTHSTCTVQGTEAEVCKNCGFILGETTLPCAEHAYGEWSEYVHDEESGREISSRCCADCGNVQTRSYIANVSTITADTFFENIFQKLVELIMQMLLGSFKF